MNLDHALGQIGPDANGSTSRFTLRFTLHPNSCNLLHGLPLS